MKIGIEFAEVMHNSLPPRQLKLVLAWAELQREDVLRLQFDNGQTGGIVQFEIRPAEKPAVAGGCERTIIRREASL